MRFVPQASSPLNAIGINPGQVEERQYVLINEFAFHHFLTEGDSILQILTEGDSILQFFYGDCTWLSFTQL